MKEELIFFLRENYCKSSLEKAFWTNLDNENFLISFAKVTRFFKNSQYKEFPLERTLKTVGKQVRFYLLINAKNKSIKEILLRGSDEEQSLCLKVLSHLKNPKDFHSLAVNACRTNSINVFSAIALNNPFPSSFFSEEEFNQMYLKTIFLDLNTEKIFNGEKMINKNLEKSLQYLFEERKSAGRTFPKKVLDLMKKRKIL